jgi:hypothetical protein
MTCRYPIIGNWQLITDNCSFGGENESNFTLDYPFGGVQLDTERGCLHPNRHPAAARCNSGAGRN